MKERGILFSAPMVFALRGNRKTQTRRTRGLDKINEAPDEWEYRGFDPEDNFHAWHRKESGNGECFVVRCPYGVPGDRLWVRETWQGFRSTSHEYDEVETLSKEERGDRTINDYAEYYGIQSIRVRYKADGIAVPDSWLPGIHMPRWASRDTLEVVSVRPECLQDIHAWECIMEGIEGDIGNARHNFAKLWEEINGSGSWDKNPFVWRVEFRRLNA